MLELAKGEKLKNIFFFISARIINSDGIFVHRKIRK
jgi:hypothetical protein